MKFLIGVYVMFLQYYGQALQCYQCYMGKHCLNDAVPEVLLINCKVMNLTGSLVVDDLMVGAMTGNETHCIVLKFRYEDILKSQTLRMCGYGDYCSKIETMEEIIIDDCRTCTDDGCNEANQNKYFIWSSLTNFLLLKLIN